MPARYRPFAKASAFKMSRFTKLSLDLYRIQPLLPVKLRDFETQMQQGRKSFDLKLHYPGPVVRPLPIDLTEYPGPNGMSLRPLGEAMLNILAGFQGPARIYFMPEGMQLPEELCVFHERTDHYSMQVTREMPLEEFNQILTELLKS
ncbi:hypothetical protein HDU96_004917, partial [Phlyctochytrium bullatum]